jgi:hypothetical protein
MPEEDGWVQEMGKGYQKSDIRYQEADGGGAEAAERSFDYGLRKTQAFSG